jgi:hypothetical protein
MRLEKWNPAEQDHAAALDDVVTLMERDRLQIDDAADKIAEAMQSLERLSENGQAALRALRTDVRTVLKGLIAVWDLEASVASHSNAAQRTRELLERIG